MLYVNLLDIPEKEKGEVVEFLETEYQKESLNFPYQAPSFDPEAALWSAIAVYRAAQLILYRENKEADLALLLQDFSKEMTTSAILSADLCLRFMGDMLEQLKLIDSEDPLIELLENLLSKWHYSAIHYPLEKSSLDFETIKENKCLHQLYVNRIIDSRNMALAKHPACIELVRASLGMFAEEFWKNFKIETT